MRMINVYAMSIFNHILRVDCDASKIRDRIRGIVGKFLGGRKVRWERLVASVESGGYGLVDVERMSRVLKLGWLNYWVSGCDRWGAEIAGGWSNEVKKSNFIVGPLASVNDMSGEVECWKCNKMDDRW